jgi:hypothetical protein
MFGTSYLCLPRDVLIKGAESITLFSPCWLGVFKAVISQIRISLLLHSLFIDTTEMPSRSSDRVGSEDLINSSALCLWHLAISFPKHLH